MAETGVNFTKFSLFGVDSLLSSIEKDVILPLKFHRYGTLTKYEQDQIATAGGGVKPPPKFILISGHQGNGKKAVASVIVNEMRKGPLIKSADIKYNERNVKYLTFDPRLEYNDEYSTHFVRSVFSNARNPTDGSDFTVLLIPACPYLYLQPGVTDVLIEELDGTPPGRLLVVGTTSQPERVDPGVAAKLDCRYEVPYPDAKARKELTELCMREYNSEYPGDIGFFVRYTGDCTFSDIRRLIYRIMVDARGRSDIQLRRAGMAVTNRGCSTHPVVLTKNDFLQFMDGIEDDDEDGDNPVEVQLPPHDRYAVGPQVIPQEFNEAERVRVVQRPGRPFDRGAPVVPHAQPVQPALDEDQDPALQQLMLDMFNDLQQGLRNLNEGAAEVAGLPQANPIGEAVEDAVLVQQNLNGEPVEDVVLPLPIPNGEAVEDDDLRQQNHNGAAIAVEDDDDSSSDSSSNSGADSDDNNVEVANIEVNNVPVRENEANPEDIDMEADEGDDENAIMQE